MVYFCPNCFEEIPSQADTCPHCGYRLAEWGAADFDEKLTRALRHPEPFTRRRAAYVLGERKTASAFTALLAAFQNDSDPYFKAEILRALLKIDPRKTRRIFNEKKLEEESIVVRAAWADFKPGEG